jgi:hypothetical protein
MILDALSLPNNTNQLFGIVKVLLGIARYCHVLPGIARYCQVLPGIDKNCSK